MPRKVIPLTAPKCDAHKYSSSGGNKLSDGDGLYLEAMPTGRKSWRMKYKRPDGKEDRLVFGDYPSVGLRAARDERAKAKELLAKNIDPKTQGKKDKAARQDAYEHTFEVAARKWHAETCVEKQWKPITAATSMSRLEKHVFPFIGARPMSEIETVDLAILLDKIKKTSTPAVAQRVQWMITSAFARASISGRIKTNPARDLTGYVKVPKGRHHPALSLDQIPEFLARIDDSNAKLLTRLAIKLYLMVFIRNSELRFARWSEIDWEQSGWNVPGERVAIEGVKYSNRGMKMGKNHFVPLPRQALEILQKIHSLTGHQDMILPGEKKSASVMSENTVNEALRRMGYHTRRDVCLHGFRAMARSALGESKLWQKSALERQMSHQEKSTTEGAYTHLAEFLQERRLMMQWWADYLDANRQQAVTPYDFAHSASDKVVEIQRA
jgi:integrase